MFTYLLGGLWTKVSFLQHSEDTKSSHSLSLAYSRIMGYYIGSIMRQSLEGCPEALIHREC